MTRRHALGLKRLARTARLSNLHIAIKLIGGFFVMSVVATPFAIIGLYAIKKNGDAPQAIDVAIFALIVLALAGSAGLLTLVRLNIANRRLKEEHDRRQSIEEQLVHAQKLLGLGTLAGGIAHDFNNMLYVILGCARLALEDVPSDSISAELLRKINQAAEHSKSIVDQVHYLSRRETSSRKTLDVGHVISESVTLLRAGLPSSMILEVAIDDDCGTVLADETQIRQLLVNLTTNAFQAHADGKGSIGLSASRVEVGTKFTAPHLRPGPHVRIGVTDSGAGIPEAILPRVQDPFFTTKPTGEGTGLGLAIVHRIVTAHKGAVSISTEVGVGTTVEVFLPISSGEAAGTTKRAIGPG